MNSFKRILALSLAVLILSSCAACQVFKSEEKTTDVNAEDLMTLTEKDVIPTDFEGNTLAEDAKSEIDDFNDKEEVLSQSPTTKNNNGTTQNNSKTENNKNNGNGGSSGKLPGATHFNTLSQEVFSKGIFTIEGTMSAAVEGKNMSLPFKLARDGKKQYVRTQYTYENFTVGMIVNNEKTYLLIPSLKIYQEMDESIFGESDYSGLTEAKTYVSTKRVKIGEDIYVCEEVRGEDGFSTFFYFAEDTGELKRIKFNDADGESLLKVNSLKPTVDKSEFAIPKGYKKTDIENLG